jgi:hypothetical protein
MAEMTPTTRPSVACLILVPSLITLAITILRLVGELQRWSPLFFSRAAGGGWAIVGISWLPFIFGPYFALKLSSAGEGPKSTWKALGLIVLAILVCMGGGVVGFAPAIKIPAKELLAYLLMAGSLAFPFLAWRVLAKVLVAYAYAARIPVAIVMFFAIRGNWGTHYDAVSPEYHRPLTLWPKYFHIGLLPQLIAWVAFTVIIGVLFGIIVAAVARLVRATPEEA